MNLRAQRLYQAGHDGLRNRMLIEWRLPEERTDRLLASWETEAEQRGLERGDFGYWSAGTDWISAAVDESPAEGTGS
jgi:hypothetical protein